MGIRKNALRLTPAERDNFLRAVLTLKNTIANPGDPPAQRISIYDRFAALHLYTLSINVPGVGSPVNMGHGSSAFGPWHRYYLLQFEQALQTVDPTVTLPYWDWTDHTGTQTVLFQDNFLGPNGGAGGVGGGTVRSGYFAFDAPGSGTNPTPLPAWWPAGLPGWRIRPSLASAWGTALQRFLGSFANLATQAHVLTPLGKPDYENVSPGSGFRPALEGGARMHNYHHTWVGGHMGDPNASPNDLIFFLHHCGIDRLWAMWQIDGHQGAAFYPASGRPQGHNLNDPMWPWVGGLAGYSSNNSVPDIVLADFSGEPVRRPGDMLDHRALGYAYDTEAIVGVSLDQSGSMTGMTPDPMTGMAPNVSKWDAAKQGVSFLLQDCEAAHAAGEAYVVAGVETFRSLGTNTFTPILPAPSFGVIKTGGSHSQAAFDAAVAGQSPGGGTPLAGTLTDTETRLVRAPFANLPAGEQRYLMILTDGKETSPPWLSTLGAPQFPDTVIFAMGFGVGGGWDGVDYATIATLATKGKAAPAGVAQVFHGENAGVIDKFYTNSIAASIGYTPTVDPVFELLPGEHLHLPFDATDADHSFMLTALGFDFTDENWEVCLMAPDGEHCLDTRHHHAPHAPDGALSHAGPHSGGGHGAGSRYLVTTRRGGGRFTLFLNRNGADSSSWVGRWNLMVFYKGQADDPVMVMPAISDLILPTGAPPVRGPLYTRFRQKTPERPVARLLPGRPAHAFAHLLPGLSTLNEGPPCAVSVGVFSKTRLHATLKAETKAPFAGQDFEMVLDVSAPGAKLDQMVVAGRLVAPRHSLGNAFADPHTIPPRARRKYVQREQGAVRFDALGYLADYEQKRADAFPVRDEEVVFRTANDGRLRARVSGNRFPGVHRVAVYVEGTYDPGETAVDEHCCKKGPQRFSRVLHAELALGIHPDPDRSRPTLHWVAPNRWIVSVTPTDALGNVAVPFGDTAPLVTINGRLVRGTPVLSLTGEQQIEIKLSGRGVRPTPDGQTIDGGAATVETLSGERLTLEPGKRLRIGIGFAGAELPVHLPRVVVDTKSRKALGAGAPEALRLPLERREVFRTRQEAKAAGFDL